MKKYKLKIIALSMVLLSCEAQDICDQKPSPRLIVKFLNNTDQSVKNLSSIKIWKDEALEENILVDQVKQDSVLVQLPNLMSDTSIKLIVQAEEQNFDEITINYTPEIEVVSKACGMKLTYHNLEVTENISTDIQTININSNTISNEDQAHLDFSY